MFEQPEEILAHLLTGIAQELDIPDQLYEGMVAEYESVGNWLVAQAIGGTTDWNVYPQGSVRLGTVVLPTANGDEYDIDLVCLRGLLKRSITQAELKSEVGEAIKAFVAAHGWRPSGPEGCKEGCRCWTLLYPHRRFHMDALPAIPDPEGSPTAILLTDRDLRLWQYSDPIGYSNWFRSQMKTEFLREREIIAKAARASVEDVPEWRVKTKLQRMVQVLKRHRDVYFADDPDARPASILITTAATLTFQGSVGSLFEAVVRAGDRMPDHFENRAGVIWLPNPVNPAENFADKWRLHPERRHKFTRWLDQLRRDLEAAAGTSGLPRVAETLQRGFGKQPVAKAAERLGREFRGLREAGQLTVTGAGLLGTGGETRVAHHSFYGARRKP